MSHRPNWRTERRANSLVPTRMNEKQKEIDARQDALGRINNDSESDGEDERPGAYAIVNGNHQEQDIIEDFDGDNEITAHTAIEGAIVLPTEDPLEVVRTRFDHTARVPVRFSQPLGKFNDEGEEDLRPSEKPPRKQKIWLFFTAMVACFIVLVVIGVVGYFVVSGKSRKEDGAESSASTDFFSDLILQCDRDGYITEPESDAWKNNYNALMKVDGIYEYANGIADSSSCDDVNVALVWIASKLAIWEEKSVHMNDIEGVLNQFSLAVLFISWGGKNWIKSDGWMEGDFECEWHGVTCDKQRQIVTLSLLNNNLQGTLGTRLGMLKHLKRLELINNRLGGSVPWGATNFPVLEHLVLDNNELTGSIPSEVWEDASLLTLSLGNNRIEGTIPSQISALSSLKLLHIGGLDLSGSIPLEWRDLRQLENLNLSSLFNLSGSILSTISQMTAIKKLDLVGTKMTGSIPFIIGQMTSLEELYLGGNAFTGLIPTSLGQLLSVETLIVANNFLTGTIPTELGNCSQLRVLQLTSNYLSGALPTAMMRLEKLESFDVSGNRDISGTIPREYTNLKNLSHFEIEGTGIEGEIPSGLCDSGTEVDVTQENEEFSRCTCCIFHKPKES